MNQQYILRIWRGQATGALRISLKAVASGELHHFVNGTAVISFLESKFGKVADNSHRTDRLEIETVNTNKEKKSWQIKDRF